jgi:hypothetical protein
VAGWVVASMYSAATSDPQEMSGRPEQRHWPSQFRPVLSSLVAGGGQYFGSDSVRVEPVRLLERPFSSLLQVRISGGQGTVGAFIKILKPRSPGADELTATSRNVQREFDITTRVRRALAPHPGLSAVRPIACFPEQFALVTERATGPTLAEVLARAAAGWSGARSAKDRRGSLRQVGAWLNAVQGSLRQEKDVDFDAMRLYLDTRLTALERVGPVRLTAAGRMAIERYRDRLMREASGEPLRQVWIHADFCPDNIIARAGEVTVLDFTMAKTGTVYHDVSHLFMRLEAMKVKPWFRPAIIEGFQQELLEAFEPGLVPGRPLFALMLLQHVICHMLALQTSTSGPAELYARWLRRRHRQWLDRVVGLGEESWSR